MTLEQPDDNQTFSIAQLAKALGAKPNVVETWARLAGATDLDALNLERCAAIGAVVTMAKRTGTKQHVLGALFLELIKYERPLDEWMVIKRFRQDPAIEQAPIKIDVTSPTKARPKIYDPLSLLARLNAAS